MKIKVCDALCGAGKTRSCINMMNNATDKKFIFITPYLDEVDRIKKECSSRDFRSPEYRVKTGFSKLEDTISLLRAGHNIASTHALFGNYTDEVKELIKKHNYVLVLDEVIDLLQPYEKDGEEINLLMRNGVVEKDGDDVIWKDELYQGALFDDVVRTSRSKNLKDYDGHFYFWCLPSDGFTCFSEVYILTYLFEFSMLRYFLKASSIDYELIGTKRENDIYQFCPLEEMNRKRDIRSLIHILDSPRYNDIGFSTFSLSSGWFKRSYDEPGMPNIHILKNNLYNFLRRAGNNNDKMWTTLNRYRGDLKGKGYSNAFIVFNKRASNAYSNKHYLAYCLNVYMFPWMRNYLAKIGQTKVNQDMYALSTLIQWLFRSAIRNGEEVWLYLPSRRMRYLLTEWLNNLAAGNDLKEIHFTESRPLISDCDINKRRKNDEGKGMRGM